MLKVLTDGCTPTKGTKHSAAIDLYASEDCTIEAGETSIIGLGVCLDIDALIESEFNTIVTERYFQEHVDAFLSSHYFQLMPRSSLRAKGLVSNTGVIDIDFSDELKIIIHNPFTLNGFNIGEYDTIHLPNKMNAHTIKKGDKIAQIILLEHKTYLSNINTVDERIGGIGSTNK